ncbi:hypothetical protein Undi14_04740 [Undibacterium sp. 14-3-2]|uniref:hypothetical protein n=1 Tax=Undibacterium sp. 14-3-2 TaxID=2800129 RepID=UPI001905B388|nr:hypothetical protein [Undibacterium sp. 14-3-2]MBK1889330.1 hypothetical protein [Undibacterium sp. 14-3-2]
MKDTELRGIVLQNYYDKRREAMFTPNEKDFQQQISIEDICAISEQLGEHRLITWKTIKKFGGVSFGMGKISAFGIDVVEGVATPDIKVEFVQNKSINITGSSNIIVGDNNQQNISHHVQEIVRAIDASQATPEEKSEAKGILKKFIEHPMVTAIAGGAISLLGS